MEKPQTRMIHYALAYAKRDWPVFPLHSVREGACSCGRADCSSVGKHPRTKNGVKDATTDPEQIRAFWQRWPEANIGIATGNGLVVLDADLAKGANLDHLLPYGVLRVADTLLVQTGNDGWHYYYQSAVPLPNSAGKLAPFIDIRGEGGYVVAPPSSNAGGPYIWLISPKELPQPAPIPPLLLARLQELANGQQGKRPPAHTFFQQAVSDADALEQKGLAALPSKGAGQSTEEYAAQLTTDLAADDALKSRNIAAEACNEFLVRYAGGQHRMGLSVEEVRNQVIALNEQRYGQGRHPKGPLDPQELERTIFVSLNKWENQRCHQEQQARLASQLQQARAQAADASEAVPANPDAQEDAARDGAQERAHRAAQREKGEDMLLGGPEEQAQAYQRRHKAHGRRAGSASQSSQGTSRRHYGLEIPVELLMAELETPSTLGERRIPDEIECGPLPTIYVHQVLHALRDNEQGDARLCALLLQNCLAGDGSRGTWYLWHEHFWQEDARDYTCTLVGMVLAPLYQRAHEILSVLMPPEEASREEKQLVKSLLASLSARASDLQGRQRAERVLKYVHTLLDVPARVWDADPWLLGTPGGTLDLRSGELHPGRPEQYIRTIVPTTWQGLDAPAPRFEQFLREIFADREQYERELLIAFVQRILGYGITGHVNEHIFLMLYGDDGRNGKDTLTTTLQHVLGGSVGAISSDVLISGSRLATPGGAKSHLRALQGKRLAWASEIAQGARFDISQLKMITGGGEISARELYEKESTFAPSHLLLLLSNSKPHASAEDKAFWERLRLITFSMRFVERPVGEHERARDPELLPKLAAEASGILAWLVRGALAWRHEGLNPPREVLLATEAYRRDEDQLEQFIADRCILHPQASVTGAALFNEYMDWGKVNNVHSLLNGKHFGQRIGKRPGVTKDRIRQGTLYQGVGLCGEDITLELGVGCVGSVQGPAVHPTHNRDGSTGSFNGHNHNIGVGCVGSLPKVFHEKTLPPEDLTKCYRETSGNHPTHPTPSSSESAVEQPVERLGSSVGSEPLPYTAPTPGSPIPTQPARNDWRESVEEEIALSDDERELEVVTREAVLPLDPFFPPAGPDEDDAYLPDEEEYQQAGEPLTEADLEDTGWPDESSLWGDELLDARDDDEGDAHCWA